MTSTTIPTATIDTTTIDTTTIDTATIDTATTDGPTSVDPRRFADVHSVFRSFLRLADPVGSPEWAATNWSPERLDAVCARAEACGIDSLGADTARLADAGRAIDRPVLASVIIDPLESEIVRQRALGAITHDLRVLGSRAGASAA